MRCWSRFRFASGALGGFTVSTFMSCVGRSRVLTAQSRALHQRRCQIDYQIDYRVARVVAAIYEYSKLNRGMISASYHTSNTNGHTHLAAMYHTYSHTYLALATRPPHEHLRLSPDAIIILIAISVDNLSQQQRMVLRQRHAFHPGQAPRVLAMTTTAITITIDIDIDIRATAVIGCSSTAG